MSIPLTLDGAMPEAPPLKEPLWWRYDQGRIVLPDEEKASGDANYATFVGRYGPYRVWSGTPGLRYVNSFRTKKGGFTKATIRALGVKYPPKKGWLRGLAAQIDEKLLREAEDGLSEEFKRLASRDQ